MAPFLCGHGVVGFWWWLRATSYYILLPAHVYEPTASRWEHTFNTSEMLIWLDSKYCCKHNISILTARFFKRQDPASNDLLHHLLPKRRDNDTIRSLRNSQPFSSIRACTNKFHKSFLPYCLKNFTVSLYQLILSDRRSVILQCRVVYVVVLMFYVQSIIELLYTINHYHQHNMLNIFHHTQLHRDFIDLHTIVQATYRLLVICLTKAHNDWLID